MVVFLTSYWIKILWHSNCSGNFTPTIVFAPLFGVIPPTRKETPSTTTSVPTIVFPVQFSTDRSNAAAGSDLTQPTEINRETMEIFVRKFIALERLYSLEPGGYFLDIHISFPDLRIPKDQALQRGILWNRAILSER